MRLNFKSRKAKISIIMSIILVCAVVAIISGNAVVNSEKDANTSITERLTEETSESTTKLTNETTTQQKETETTEAKRQSDSGSRSSSGSSSKKSSSSKSSSSSSSSSSKKQTTTKKQSSTSKPKSYAMSTTEIRNYALEQIAKIDGTIYCSDMTKDNSGWYSPTTITNDMTESEVKSAIRGSITFYDKYTNGYNVYVEETKDWSATVSSNGEVKEYYTPCIKVYFLYGHVYTGPPVIDAY